MNIQRVLRPIFWIGVVLVGAWMLGMLYDQATERPAQVSSEQGSGEALIGGPFTLVNAQGEAVRDADFRGKFMLVFFGFTFCPDICPTDLAKMSTVLQGLGERAESLAPVFITIDPERDTVEQMASYMQNFDARITGLTGTKEQIAAVQQAYRVYAKKIEMEGMSGYMMDHSAFMYVMGKDGKYITHFRHNDTADAILATLNTLL